MRRIATLAATAAAALSANAVAAEPISVRERFEVENQSPGLKAMGWEMRPSIALRGGYDDNANRSVAGPEESGVVALRGAIDARRQLGPAELAFDASVGQDWYPSTPDEDVLTAKARLRGAIYAGNQMTLSGSMAIEREAEGISSTDNGVVVAGVLDPYVGRAEFTRIPVSVGLEQDFGRFFWDASLGGVKTEYDQQRTEGGLVIAQDFRNGLEAGLSARVGYRFTQGYGVFIRGEGNQRRYDDDTADNEGWKVSGGVAFELTRLLTGELSAGWAQQTYAVNKETNGALIYGAGLTWFASPLLSLTLDAARNFRAEQSISGTGTSTTTPVLTDTVALTAELEVLRQLMVMASVGYSHNESDDGTQDNSLTRLSLGSAYSLNRYLRLNAEYEHTMAETNNSGDIVRNAVSLGIIASY